MLPGERQAITITINPEIGSGTSYIAKYPTKTMTSSPEELRALTNGQGFFAFDEGDNDGEYHLANIERVAAWRRTIGGRAFAFLGLDRGTGSTWSAGRPSVGSEL